MCKDLFKNFFCCSKEKSEPASSCQKVQIVRNHDVPVEILQSSGEPVFMYVKPTSIKEYYVNNIKVNLFECDNKDKGPLYFLLDSSDENAIALSKNLSGFNTVRIEEVFYNCYYIIEGKNTPVLTTCDFTE